MTQKPSAWILTLIATVSLAGSVFVWTLLVETMMNEKRIWTVLDEEGIGALRMLTDDEEVYELRPSAPEPIDELRQWELRNSYGISIPKLGVRAPVILPSMRYWNLREWDLLENQMQVGMSYGSVAYPHSARPGRRGTVFVAGHSSPPHMRAEQSEYGSLFERLPELAIGDSIFIKDGETDIEYVVTESEVMAPTSTKLLGQQLEDSILKLITCFPVGSTKDRLVVTAKRVEQ